MARLVWITDIHLDFCSEPLAERFFEEVAACQPDGILLGGDISEADRLPLWLQRMDETWQMPIYFVLGNHDYYGSSIASVRQAMRDLTLQHPRLHYLTAAGPVLWSDQWALLGHDGWADGRIGNFVASIVMMQDYVRIAELSNLDKARRWDQLRQLGDEAAAEIQRQLQLAAAERSHLLMLTHVPPFREACWYEGRISDDQWAPHFTCQAVGEVVRTFMRAHPHHRLTILCGHTHSAGIARLRGNVTVYTGGAEYGQPRVAQVIELSADGALFAEWEPSKT